MKITLPQSSPLAQPLYTSAEAACYARLNIQTMQRWLYGGPEGERVVYTPHEDRVVSFVDFVQALAIHDIRLGDVSVSLQKIREAVRIARDEYEIEHPLARRHTLFAVGRDIVIIPDKKDTPIEITGKHKNQRAMKPIIERFMRELHYGSDGYADKYTLFRDHDIEIQMDPTIRFGEPILKSCSYTPYALWMAAKAEGDVDRTAKEFGVKPEEVWAAIRCCDLLEPKQKAA